MITLYRSHAKSLGTWRIWSDGPVIHIAHATSIGGSEVTHEERVTTNLSGRTLDEQVQLRINSRISRMLDRGYKPTQQEALQSSGNQMGLDRPMLAQKFRDAKNVSLNGAVMQKKLDGHRCLVTCQDGEIIAYSRHGKPITSIQHILRGLKGRLPEGTTIDGELYIHGYKLQTLSSWIKREQPSTYHLNLVVYDLMAPDRYTDRHEELTNIISKVDTGFPGKVIVLPYRDYEDRDLLMRYFRDARRQNFEGLMLRTDGIGYEAGKRSYSLLKVKAWLDCEITVIKIEPSKTGWARCLGVTDEGKEVWVSAPGTIPEKEEVMANAPKYLGRRLTIEFAHYTNDGIPFQPTALRWCDDI